MPEKANLFLGKWKRALAYGATGFAQDETSSEPHLKRRREILAKYPQISSLFAYDRSTVLIGLLAVANQMLIAKLLVDSGASNAVFFLTALLVGASLSQVLGEVIHECSHNSAAKTVFANKIVSMLCNAPLPFPLALPFRKHHLSHHIYLNVEGKDPDLPLRVEISIIGSNSFLKAIWIVLMPLFYVFRGALQNSRINGWELLNLAFIAFSNFLIWKYLGANALFYLALSFWLGYSVHPVAAHFLQEHYTFADGQETYSYYGFLNVFFLNVGYHNEHHDFPAVPWQYLPLLHRLAADYYGPPLFSHESWVLVMWKIVKDRCLGPASRVVRSLAVHLADRKAFCLKNS